MARPFTDIAASITANPVKNGTLLVSTGGFRKGSSANSNYKTNNTYVQNTPTIATIQQKYGYRFYNGIFVNGVDNGVV